MIRRFVISPRDPCDVLTRDADLVLLRREFPTVGIETRTMAEAERPTIDVDEWRDPEADLTRIDARLGAYEAIALVARGGPIEDAALQVLTRYQGLVDRRNEASATRLFDRILASRLEGEADRATALDTWQWLLRLAPGAGLGLQIAALFRDVLPHEAEAPWEHGDSRTSPALRLRLARLAVPTPVSVRAYELAVRSERLFGDAELAILDDAAALSFFSRRSDTTLRRLGLVATRRAVHAALHRLRPAARARLLHVRLVPGVWRIVEDALRYEHR